MQCIIYQIFIQIHFCPDDNIIIDSYWMNGKSELITHTLWKPPYKTNTFLPSMVSLSHIEILTKRKARNLGLL